MDEVAITIIGAGAVGLAVAAELAGVYEDVLVLERHDGFGRETSSRNSEVIHSGIYYPKGSLKAGLCVEGAALLYKFAEEYSVPHRRTGKLIVAADEAEAEDLPGLHARGAENGVRGLVMLDRAETARIEPNINAVSALYSPDTGIIDSHALMARLYRLAQASGAALSFGSEVCLVERETDGYVIGVKGEDYRFRTRVFINSAGLFADRVAGLAGVDIDRAGCRLEFWKGSYFSYGKRSPVGRLVYPIPHKDLRGLGVHATLDLAGRLRFGPDAERVEHINYDVDPARRDVFFEGASRIIRGLDREAFSPDTAGIRPKLAGGGVRDFIIRHEPGFEGMISLVGIESPGLTACLAIARRVKGMVDEVLK